MIGDIPMRRFENQIFDREMIREILDQILVVNVGVNDGEYPYIVPLNFGYEMTEEKLLVYVHGAREGHKVDLWRKNPKVSLTFSMFTNHPQDKYRGEMHDYRSIMANGIIREVVRHQSHGQHGRAVQAILRHNGRRPNQFSVKHYAYMAVFVIECDWKHVTAKSEMPMESVKEVTFPTLEEIRASQEPKYDFAYFFNRKIHTARAGGTSESVPVSWQETPKVFPAEGVGLSGKGTDWRLNFVWEQEAAELDCDVVALLLDQDQKVLRRYDLAYYNQKTDRYGVVTHLGDDRLHTQGQETLSVNPEKIPEFCEQIVFWVSVHEADSRDQNLGMLKHLRLCVGAEATEQNCYVLEGDWAGKQAAVAACVKKQSDGSWLLTGPDGTTLEDWRITAMFAYYGLVRWKE